MRRWLLKLVCKPFLKLRGTLPVEKEVLNIIYRGLAKIDLRVFKVELKGPVTFPEFSLNSSFSISFAVVGKR